MTERMLGVLRVLAKADEPMTCNAIGHALGFTHGMHDDRYSHNGKRMGAANRVNFAVSRLEHLGLVQFGRRPDGLSGTAYRITVEGTHALQQETMAKD